MGQSNRQWIVAQASQSPGIGLERACFGQRDGAIPGPGVGQILIRNGWFACDPMNHAWVKGLEARFSPIPVGGIMRGGVAGRVVESRHPDFAPGDAVTGFLDWADYTLSTGGVDYTGTPLQKLPADLSPASGLATLGMTGHCAWLGLFDIGRPRPGDTVVVSGAAGAIGTVAVQLARLAGCRVIGIAGGPRKCSFLLKELGIDAAIDYQRENVAERLRETCPSGIDVFFDNVGGVVLDTALTCLARGARVVVCGGISGYNSAAHGLTNHLMLAIQGATMAGFFYFDHVHRLAEINARLADLLRSGDLREVLDVAEGFDSVPDAALGQFQGKNLGKQLVRIAAI
ncbi:MAG: NADP-dependent oxidoreductase [Pseudomonadales bacterium]